MRFYGILIFIISIIISVASNKKIKEYERVQWDSSKEQRILLEYFQNALKQSTRNNTTQRTLISEIENLLCPTDIRNDYSSIKRDKVIQLCDSLQIEYPTYGSFSSIISTLFSTIDLDKRENGPNSKILILDTVNISADSAKIYMALFGYATKQNTDFAFYHNQIEIEKQQVEKGEIDLGDISVIITNPATCQEVTVYNPASNE